MHTEKKSSGFDMIAAASVLAVIAAIVYMVVRAVLVYSATFSFVDGTLAVLLISAEFFVLFHSIGYTMNILIVRKSRHVREAGFSEGPLDQKHLPPVAILVPARHEPRDVLEKTFLTINNIEYENKKVYFLDDSVEGSYKLEAEEIAREHELILFRRAKPWHGAKAGIVNDCMAGLTEKYVVIFDADQNPTPDFLKVLVPMMEANEKLAFIQTPQFYSNIDTNLIARAAVMQQAVFYEYICEGKGVADSMFCCGTNVIFRASALQDVGGMDESTVTEDFATSLRLHVKGYRSLYYNHVCAFGMGPEDLNGYFKQQFRWATGTIAVFRKVLARFLTRPFSLKWNQWLEYFLSSTYYFVGCAFFIMISCPVIFIFLKVPSFFAKPEVYFLTFLPYLILSMSVFYYALRRRNYKSGDLVLGQLLGAIAFPVYVKAAMAAVLGVRVSFGVTPKSKGGAVPYRGLWAQIAILLVSFIATVWAANRFVYERDTALLVNGLWTLYHALVMCGIFYFNTGSKALLNVRRLPRGLKAGLTALPAGEVLDPEFSPKECLEIFCKQPFNPGAKVLCKVSKKGDHPVLFEGIVMSEAQKTWPRGYHVCVGIFSVPASENERLMQWIKK